MGPEPHRRERQKYREWHAELKLRDKYREDTEREYEAQERIREEIANEPPSSSYEPGKLRVVYFIEAPELNRVKIGVASNPERRFMNLSVGSPVELRIAGVFFGSLYLEQYLHKKFAQFHVRGEWFEFAPELREYLAFRMGGSI